MSTPTIRAALERLLAVCDTDESNVLDIDPDLLLDAIVFACAALAAEPVGEGLSDDELLRCASIGTPCYDTKAWDRELRMMRAAIAADRARWGHPAAPAAPKSGEVGEVVAWIHRQAIHGPDADEWRRAATLLQQQQHLLKLACQELDNFMEQQQAAPAPPVVAPISHAERLRIVKRGITAGYNLGHHHTVEGCCGDPDEVAADYAQEVLEDLGDAPAPAVVPVAVSERLPGEGDCDEEGRSWCYTPREDFDGVLIMHSRWILSRPAEIDTHWLPAHAIPLPQAGEGEA